MLASSWRTETGISMTLFLFLSALGIFFLLARIAGALRVWAKEGESLGLSWRNRGSGVLEVAQSEGQGIV